MHPKWPNVPACHGWLSLDRRGTWRLQGEPVSHRGLIDFINRNYGNDDTGCWFVQNGPQRVFVELACTPWVFRLTDGTFTSHTGLPAGAPSGIGLDADGNIYVESPIGPGLLDDRDLAVFLAQCTLPDATPVPDDTWLAFINGGECPICWQGIELTQIQPETLPGRYGFVRSPAP